MRLENGIDNQVQETNTIEFIIKEEAPTGSTVIYANFVCDYRPLKPKPYIVGLTVGGDKVEYPDDKSSLAASLLE